MRILKIIAASLAIAGSAAACNTPSGSTVGGVAGAGLGGLLGSQFGSGTGQIAAIIGGAMIGGLLGSTVGDYMDEQDQQQAQIATQQAVASPGQQVAWSNPQTGNSGTVQTTAPVQYAPQTNCSKYYQTVYVNGRSETIEGWACQKADGVWFDAGTGPQPVY